MFQTRHVLSCLGMLLVCLDITLSFIPSHQLLVRPKRFPSIALAGSPAESFDSLSHDFADCSVPQIQKILVQKGVEFKQQQQATLNNRNLPDSEYLQSNFEKVPGCVANVFIQTSLYKPNGEGEKDCWKVVFGGNADALLSRGLLAVLVASLSSTSDLEEIRNVDAYSIADQMGIRRALSPGRNDGLANMMQIIQKQIQVLLERANGLENGISPPLFIDETTAPTDMTITKQKQSTESIPPQGNIDASKMKATVALLLSGGVDSSVALHLLLQQGYDVTAFYLKIWLEDELAHLGQCPWEDDYNICQEVCEQAGVPLESISLQQEYRERVISYTIHEAQRGRTPNPDILCNSRIKFGCFYDAIDSRDFDFVASGHYARLEPNWASNDDDDRANKGMDTALRENTEMRLFRAPDPVKDQSYFLCALSQDQLKRVLFPIGHLQKARVRELAEEFSLPNRHRADSQGLCFLGKVKFEEFLGAYLGEKPGDIVDAATGDILGRHRGVWFHTVGQRKGIGKVLYPLATSRGPWYVVAKDPAQDLVFCSNQYDEDIFAAARSEFHVEDMQWVAGTPPQAMQANSGMGRFEMKIRHGPKLVEGLLTLSDTKGDSGAVKLDNKDGGLAPGQYVVFYEGEECLGGGVISERHWAKFLMQQETSNNHTTTTATVLAS